MLNSSFEYWHTFSRYFPFVVTTDSNNVACNFYSSLALLFWSHFSKTLKNKSEQRFSNASLLVRSGANEFGNKGFSGDRSLYCSTVFILGCFIALKTLVSTLKLDKVQEVF